MLSTILLCSISFLTQWSYADFKGAKVETALAYSGTYLHVCYRNYSVPTHKTLVKGKGYIFILPYENKAEHEA